MGLIQRLFSKKVSLRELKVSLLKLERERKRRDASLRKLEGRTEELVEKIKKARRQGNHGEVDYLWEDLKHARTECTLERRQARVLGLEAIALKRTVWGLERLEAAKNRTGVQELLKRLSSSGLDAKLGMQEIREEEYLRELDEILQSMDLVGAESSGVADDPEKAAFLAEIDAINAAEEMGDAGGALERETGLKNRLRAEESGN
ncbi:MAG: hypothetical protein O7J95_10635 [Planctomycetota bacterium]|nr:hypothetical protein [Planctomycetota bacterium]